jgi:hypothetical protein
LVVFSLTLSDGSASSASLCSTNATLVIMSCVHRFEVSRCCDLGGQTTPPVWLDRPRWLPLLVESSSSTLSLNGVTQWFCGEPLETARTWCSLPPISTHGSARKSSRIDVILRLNHETVHDFVLLLLPPCGPHLTPWTTVSLEPSLLVCSTPGGPPA